MNAMPRWPRRSEDPAGPSRKSRHQQSNTSTPRSRPVLSCSKAWLASRSSRATSGSAVAGSGHGGPGSTDAVCALNLLIFSFGVAFAWYFMLVFSVEYENPCRDHSLRIFRFVGLVFHRPAWGIRSKFNSTLSLHNASERAADFRPRSTQCKIPTAIHTKSGQIQLAGPHQLHPANVALHRR